LSDSHNDGSPSLEQTLGAGNSLADQDTAELIDQIVVTSRMKITIILLTQVICMLLIMAALVALNIGALHVSSDQLRTIFNTALLGYLGTLVFFRGSATCT